VPLAPTRAQRTGTAGDRVFAADSCWPGHDDAAPGFAGRAGCRTSHLRSRDDEGPRSCWPKAAKLGLDIDPVGRVEIDALVQRHLRHAADVLELVRRINASR